MGLVYLAEDPSLNRQVAIKMLDIAGDSVADQEFLRSRLLRDARAAAVLSHPNIVAVYDIVEESRGAEGSSVYVVMEYIEGESLASYLDHTPTPDNANVMRVLRQMAAGLDYTHSKGIIHRDIKPGNVMLSPGGEVKILDFGIARMSDVRTSTPTGVVMGTVDYMSPEQIKGETVDGRSDQFSLAAVAYRMLSGSTLFGRHTLATLAYKVVNEAPQPVCQRNALIPPAVDPVLAKALSKSAADRYPTCRAFVEDLGQGLSGAMDAPTATLVHAAPAVPLAPIGGETTIKTPLAMGVVARPEKPKRIAALVAGGVLAASVTSLFWVKKPWQQPAQTTSVSNPMTAVTPPEKTPDKPAEVVPPPIPNPDKPSAHTPDTKTPDAKVPEKKVTANAKTPETKAPPSVATPPPVHDKPVPVEAQPQGRPTEVPETPVVTVETNPPTPSLDNPPANTPQDTPFKRGLEALRTKDYQGAVREYTTVIGRRPRNGAAYYDRALAYQFLGDNAHAIQDYADAIRVGHRDARTYASKGVCEVRMHQDDAALADFNSAIEIDPGAPTALNGRGGILYRRHQYKMAIRDFTAAIKAHPEFVQAYENRANARRASGDTFGAADDLAIANRLKAKK